MTSNPLTFQPATDGVPNPARGARASARYADLVATCRAHPNEYQWFDCPTVHNAYSSASTLRKTYGLDAHARGTRVYVAATNNNGPTAS